MQLDFWHDRWRSNQIGFHRADVNPALREHFPRLAAAPGETVLVPLCGKSLDMLWLAEQGLTVVGVEASPIAVAAFFREHGMVPERRTAGAFEVFEHGPFTLLLGDFFALGRGGPLAPVRYAYDRAALVALPPGMRARYAAHLRALLAPGARLLLLAFEYDQALMDGPPFAVREDELQRLFGETLAIETLGRRPVLEELAHLRERGLQAIDETVYLLTSRV